MLRASVAGPSRANMTCSRVPVLAWHGRNDYNRVRADVAAVLRAVAVAREAVGRSCGETLVELADLSSRALEDSQRRRAGWVGAEGHLLRAAKDAAAAAADMAAAAVAASVVELAVGNADAAALGAHAMLGEQAARMEAVVEAVYGRGDRMFEGRAPYDDGPFFQGLISHELLEQYERKGAVRQHRPSGRVPTLLPV